MGKVRLVFVLILISVIVFMGCNKTIDDTQGHTISISAAASLTDALTEIQEEYANRSDDVLHINFAASGTLRKQIEEGAPCDLFISASKSHMDKLEDEELIYIESRKNLLRNKLVLIAAYEKSDKVTLESLTNDSVGSISIGTPDSVPAGKYAQQTIEYMGIWEQIKDKLVFAKDVRQVLQYVETGNVDCGLVYKSDAVMLETGEIIAEVAEESHDPIVYPVAIIKGSQEKEQVKEFYKFLDTDYAKKTFEKYGFTIY
ncbi:molybdate ABC transporter substrate-binding protein [Sporosalibacterium faouarense]|uniref:molybdate ABC transporter substrate-binding protein n=1 Tax=Sporosalibacterium faouarense TaxID=516123 RepID=UPI00141C83A2|nr:molybdate ABC transporter substrate-binding protein [Sporosalibacterium faouarense]MTI46593.1 molybdate ABC transporter substrate-binding protein [Bacillota bacterium]